MEQIPAQPTAPTLSGTDHGLDSRKTRLSVAQKYQLDHVCSPSTVSSQLPSGHMHSQQGQFNSTPSACLLACMHAPSETETEEGLSLTAGTRPDEAAPADGRRLPTARPIRGLHAAKHTPGLAPKQLATFFF